MAIHKANIIMIVALGAAVCASGVLAETCDTSMLQLTTLDGSTATRPPASECDGLPEGVSPGGSYTPGTCYEEQYKGPCKWLGMFCQSKVGGLRPRAENQCPATCAGKCGRELNETDHAGDFFLPKCADLTKGCFPFAATDPEKACEVNQVCYQCAATCGLCDEGPDGFQAYRCRREHGFDCMRTAVLCHDPNLTFRDRVRATCPETCQGNCGSRNLLCRDIWGAWDGSEARPWGCRDDLEWCSNINNRKACPVTCGACPWDTTRRVAYLFGDPHMQNIRGEQFEVRRPGPHKILSVSQDSGAGSALLQVDALMGSAGATNCSALFVTRLMVAGQWLGGTSPLTFSASGGPASQADGPGLQVGNSSSLTIEEFVRRVPSALVTLTKHPELFVEPERQNSHATSLIAMLRFASGVRMKVSWVSERTSDKTVSKSLWLSVTGLSSVRGDIGGLLGLDDHHRAAMPEPACDAGGARLEARGPPYVFARASREQ